MTGRPLSGRTAYISGSGRNIGRAVAVELARLGSNVVVNGARDRAACDETAALAAGHGVETLVAMGDVADPAAFERIASQALSRFGTVDIVVNNAAIRPHKPFLETTEAEWHAVVDLGLTAAYRSARAFLPGMVEQGWGRIVNMTGMNAIRGYFEGAPISAAKHGVLGLTKALAVEFAAAGVTVNAVSPGTIRTEGRDGSDPALLARIPVGFLGEPEDIAGLVGFLAAPGGRFVTGQMVAANGGAAT